MTNEWELAVFLHTIRLSLLRRSFEQGQYRIPKKHGNSHGKDPANFTSFLFKDQQYGLQRNDRNPILFQLKRTNLAEPPTEYAKIRDRTILDAWSHGLRDFGDDLPLCISTEIEGHDIETYFRRNSEISYYDLIARMPNGYFTGPEGKKWSPSPPRVGTLSMRATRFRARAGCLSWTVKGDSDAKNNYMLSLMPAMCEQTNSTRYFRDLTKQEQVDSEQGKGLRPNKARKEKREAAAMAASATGSGDDDGSDSEDDVDSNENPSVTDAAPRQGMQSPGDRGSVETSHQTPVSRKLADFHLQSPSVPHSDSRLHDQQVKRRRLPNDGSSAVNTDREPSLPDSVRVQRRGKAQSTRGRPSHTPSRKAIAREPSTSNTTHSMGRDAAAASNYPFLSLPKNSNGAESKFPNWFIEVAQDAFGVPEMFNPDSPEFQQETRECVMAGDYRYYAPVLDGKEADVEAISTVARALELSKMDYFAQTGRHPPRNLSTYGHESYASQFRRLNEMFVKEFEDEDSTRALYSLAPWKDGFAGWQQVLDTRGLKLWRRGEPGEF